MKIEVKRDKESLVALGCHLGIMKKLYRLYWIVRLSIAIGLVLLPVSFNIPSELISGICFVLALILLVAIPILCNRRKHFYLAATNVFTDALIKIIDDGVEAISNAYIETGNGKLLISSDNVRVSCPPMKIKKTIKQNIESKNFLFVYFADKILTIPENGLPNNVSLDEIDSIMHQKREEAIKAKMNNCVD